MNTGTVRRLEKAASEPPPSGEEVASLIGHELRTPLTVLYSCLQLLDRSLSQDAAGREYLAEALAEARQLRGITDQILEAMQMHEGSVRIAHEDVDLAGVARRAVSRAEPLSRGQRIRLHLPEQRLPPVNGDGRRLEQALLNMIVNAITFAPDTLEIDIRVKPEGDEIRLEVVDYGPGIKRWRLDHVTRAFYQAPRSDRPSRGGLGLGLYMSREIARLHHGRLELASQEGQGSTASLVLPVKRQAGARRPPAGAESREVARQPRHDETRISEQVAMPGPGDAMR